MYYYERLCRGICKFRLPEPPPGFAGSGAEDGAFGRLFDREVAVYGGLEVDWGGGVEGAVELRVVDEIADLLLHYDETLAEGVECCVRLFALVPIRNSGRCFLVKQHDLQAEGVFVEFDMAPSAARFRFAAVFGVCEEWVVEGKRFERWTARDEGGGEAVFRGFVFGDDRAGVDFFRFDDGLATEDGSGDGFIGESAKELEVVAHCFRIRANGGCVAAGGVDSWLPGPTRLSSLEAYRFGVLALSIKTP